MGQRYLIDTNVLIDFQVRIIPPSGQAFIADIIDESFVVSFINYIEYLVYEHVTEDMLYFISLATVIETNKLIIDQTIAIRKAYKIKLPDAIVAATALVNNLTLVSRNTKDFHKIQGLTILNPYSL
jgi:predicted nucleic acid-binding protein